MTEWVSSANLPNVFTYSSATRSAAARLPPGPSIAAETVRVFETQLAHLTEEGATRFADACVAILTMLVLTGTAEL